jgi:hypothetical protein
VSKEVVAMVEDGVKVAEEQEEANPTLEELELVGLVGFLLLLLQPWKSLVATKNPKLHLHDLVGVGVVVVEKED